MMPKRLLKSLVRRDFLRNEEGTIALETMVILPVLFWTYLAMFSIFDAFHMYSLNQKAAYTIGDAVSREMVPLDDEYLDGIKDMFEYLSYGGGPTTLRITSVQYDADKDEFRRDWSRTRGLAAVPLMTEDGKNWTDRLPMIRDNEYITIVETWKSYQPPFNTGLEQREIRNFIFTRPRYTPCILFGDTGDTC